MADPLQHFDYPALERSCDCPICVGWAEKKRAYEALAAVVAGHGRSCRCDGCKRMRRSRTVYHAANNRRDLYCEFSYHAKSMPDGAMRMAWLENEVMDPGKGDGWWASRAPYYPLGFWHKRFERCAVIAVTGFARPEMFLYPGAKPYVSPSNQSTVISASGSAIIIASQEDEAVSVMQVIDQKLAALKAKAAEIAAEIERHENARSVLEALTKGENKPAKAPVAANAPQKRGRKPGKRAAGGMSARETILRVLGDAGGVALATKDIVQRAGHKRPAIAQALTKLNKAGDIVNQNGRWALKQRAAHTGAIGGGTANEPAAPAA